VIVWGGEGDYEQGNGLLSDGAAYDPQRDRWRIVADSPLTERSGHLAAWTGSEMLIWGGHRMNYIEPPDGAAYDPARDRWREIADGPLEWRPNATSVWTGTEWVIAITDGREERTDAAAYDPAANIWRSLPSLAAPSGTEKDLVWTGDQLVLNEQGGTLQRLPPDAEEWIAVDALPGGFPIVGRVTWTGEQVIGIAQQYVGTQQPRYRSFLVSWDAASEAWQSLAPAEQSWSLNDSKLVWADGRAVALGSDLAYDVASKTWWAMPTPTWDDRYYAVILWAGDRLFVWGGGEGDEIPAAFEDGFVMKPDW